MIMNDDVGGDVAPGDGVSSVRTEYVTAGPFVVFSVADAISQVEKQGWVVRFVAFAGMLSPAIRIAGPQQQLPGFIIIACKDGIEGEKVVPPNIVLNQPKVNDAKNTK